MYLSELFLTILNEDYSEQNIINALVSCIREARTRDITITESRDLYDCCREFASKYYIFLDNNKSSL